MELEWNAQDPEKSLVIISRKDLADKYPTLEAKSLLAHNEPIHLCRVMMENDVISGTFLIPNKEHPIHNKESFGFVLADHVLYFIKDKDKIEEMIHDFITRYDIVYNNALEFLLGFMNFTIQEDVYFLEDYNEKLEHIEEDLFEHKAEHMEKFIMQTRKDMNILNNYYLQLSAVGETMQEIVLEKEQTVAVNLVSLYSSRVGQLLNMVATIKDYTNQIWNLRQTQLSEKQNKISTLLTIVTSIFLPMTLVSGIFGMNFVDMPLIRDPNGFLICMGICAVIGLAEIIYLWRRHWLQ